MTENQNSEYITVKEAARLINQKKRTMYNIVEKGLIKKYRPTPGKKLIRLKRDDVLEYMESTLE